MSRCSLRCALPRGTTTKLQVRRYAKSTGESGKTADYVEVKAMCNRGLRLTLEVTMLIVATGVVLADDLALDRYTIDAGGEMFTAGGDFELSGTIGQPDAGTMSGGGFDLTGGFWFPLALDDCNSDGIVNLYDYGDFEGCLSGPGNGPHEAACNCFDLDGDDDVDLSDVARFQAEFAGG